MSLISLEHSVKEYSADLLFYGAACFICIIVLTLLHPAEMGLVLFAFTIAGLFIWTLVEYLVHRFVLHRLPPFNRWNAEHHRRPSALIGSPTLMSAALLFFCAALPAWWLLDGWLATALTFGLALGYLGYGLAHHAIQHRIVFIEGQKNISATSGASWLYLLSKSSLPSWLTSRRRKHAMHHASHHQALFKSASCNFGLTNAFWDRVFGSDVGANKLTPQLKHRDPKLTKTSK